MVLTLLKATFMKTFWCRSFLSINNTITTKLILGLKHCTFLYVRFLTDAVPKTLGTKSGRDV